MLELTDQGRELYAQSDRIQCRVVEDVEIPLEEAHDLQRRLRRITATLEAGEDHEDGTAQA